MDSPLLFSCYSILKYYSKRFLMIDCSYNIDIYNRIDGNSDISITRGRSQQVPNILHNLRVPEMAGGVPHCLPA